MRNIYVTGCTGQAGACLIDHLLEVGGYDIYGLVRRTSNENTQRITHVLDKITLLQGDLTDLSSLIRTIETAEPYCVINLASQSFVHTSWQQPILTAQVTGLGVLNMIEAIRIVNPKIRFIQASSSECYGLVKDEKPLNEDSVFRPRSPYACAKAFGHYTCINARESYGMFACNAIMFNYESEVRSKEFVTRKITDAACRIKKGLQDKLHLGAIDSHRDWTYCRDTVIALRLMMEQEKPEDYVVSSGVSRSVREFAKMAFGYLGMNYLDHVVIDPDLFRPAEVMFLLGDSSKIRAKLGWQPKTSFEQMVKIMVDADLKRLDTFPVSR